MQLHYPGTNYLGPGTHIIKNILLNTKPTSRIDAIAMQHDIEYLSDGEKFESDFRAMVKADNSLQGVLMKIGLTSRIAIDAFLHMFGSQFHLNDNSSGITALQQQQLLDKARELDKWNVVDDYVIV